MTRELLTVCQRGHAMTPENRYHPPKRPGKSACLECNRLRDAQRPKRQPAPCLDCGASVGPATGKRPPQRCPDCQKRRTLRIGAANMRRYRAEGRRPVIKGERVWDDRQRARFDRYVTKGPGCWEWQGGKLKFGYGTTHIAGWTITAHRAAWEIANGLVPDGLFVLHHCDNPPCVRVDHLYLGTQRQNMDDAVARHRHQHGPDHWTNRTKRERDAFGRWKAA